MGVRSLTPSGREVAASIPWSVIEPHREQARRNYDQSLETFASWGVLDSREMAAVLRNNGLKYALSLSEEEALIIVHRIVENCAKEVEHCKSS